jgi:hypothetical protein
VIINLLNNKVYKIYKISRLFIFCFYICIVISFIMRAKMELINLNIKLLRMNQFYKLLKTDLVARTTLIKQNLLRGNMRMCR